jgi:hypothetical protein
MMRIGASIILTLVAASMTACTGITYETTTPGSLNGQLFVMWVGYDKFVYASYEDDPLVFTLPTEMQAKLGFKTFKPGLMYTDGGSIPKPLRALDGFSPWGYAPAYIVHDWLFAAHHCIVLGEQNMGEPLDQVEYDKVRAVQFEDSAVVLAEVMKTLMRDMRVEENPLAFDAISFGVDSIVARNIWNSSEPKPCEKVSEEDKKLVKGAFHAIRRSSSNMFMFLPSKARDQLKPPIIVFQQRYGR